MSVARRTFNHYSTGNGMWVSVRRSTGFLVTVPNPGGDRRGSTQGAGHDASPTPRIDHLDTSAAVADPCWVALVDIRAEWAAVQDEDQAGLEGLTGPETAWEGVGTLTWGSGGGGDGGDFVE